MHYMDESSRHDLSDDSVEEDEAVQVGDIFEIPSRRKANRGEFRTNLRGRAWGHMVLVLGRASGRAGCWRIMTITTKGRNSHDFVPFYPVPLGDHAMQLRVRDRGRFHRESYLRIKDEYWIEDRGLEKLIDWIPMEGDTGMEELLLLVDREEDREAEDIEEDDAYYSEEEGEEYGPETRRYHDGQVTINNYWYDPSPDYGRQAHGATGGRPLPTRHMASPYHLLPMMPMPMPMLPMLPQPQYLYPVHN